MEFLFSNFPPLGKDRTKAGNFADKFYSLIPDTQRLDIAVGYITADSLVELKQIVAMNNINKLNLIIGMHYLDLFTEAEYRSAVALNKFLLEENKGEVRLVTPFRFHGKMYSFTNSSGAFAGIIGSNNLSGIFENGNRIYETSVLLENKTHAEQMQKFILELQSTSTDNIGNLLINKFRMANSLLENHEFVEKIDNHELAECIAACTGTSFDIPIKATPKSNLNVFFGRGRVNNTTGLVKARHWYEVELIVPKKITVQAEFPKAGTDSASFYVITDDGWKFKCNVNGDYSKNFRSENDLKILGKWIKGRLENAGALSVGELVTEDVLHKYGRDTFTFTKTRKPDLWYLDFKVR
ncbi:restriction endonuclease PLD domain-containing protein [Phascolarctobacterium faecium]|uniref:restriction endonuclease PLD domain-containing protein n=1 Tax=Phascolarctobacterium faecium TaxID=33025 RepID=UPI003FF1332F